MPLQIPAVCPLGCGRPGSSAPVEAHVHCNRCRFVAAFLYLARTRLVRR
jgi:hypothetical protein